jgi:soluble lytic murein transglycosylase-like protein
MKAFARCKSLWGFRPVKLLFAVGVLVSASGFSQAQTGLTAENQGLVKALHQATRDVHDQSTDLDALMWLSSMSERLEARIPNPFYRIRLLKNVYREAEAEGLDPQLVLAVIDIESNFDRYAESRAGAQGLMQVMPFWKDVYGRPHDDLYNPLTSLRYGCRILRHYLDRHENQADALAAYNGSLGRSTYPDKIFRRLNSRWQYQNDNYSRQTSTTLAAR